VSGCACWGCGAGTDGGTCSQVSGCACWGCGAGTDVGTCSQVGEGCCAQETAARWVRMALKAQRTGAVAGWVEGKICSGLQLGGCVCWGWGTGAVCRRLQLGGWVCLGCGAGAVCSGLHSRGLAGHEASTKGQVLEDRYEKSVCLNGAPLERPSYEVRSRHARPDAGCTWHNPNDQCTHSVRNAEGSGDRLRVSAAQYSKAVARRANMQNYADKWVLVEQASELMVLSGAQNQNAELRRQVSACGANMWARGAQWCAEPTCKCLWQSLFMVLLSGTSSQHVSMYKKAHGACACELRSCKRLQGACMMSPALWMKVCNASILDAYKKVIDCPDCFHPHVLGPRANYQRISMFCNPCLQPNTLASSPHSTSL